MAKVVKAPASGKKTKASKAGKVKSQEAKVEGPKFRGMKGETLGLPAYATWTWIFDTQRKLANGKGPIKVGRKTYKKPLTDAQIVEFLQEEFEGKLKEGTPDGVNRLRSLYNRGKINKQESAPSKPVGEFDEEGNETVRVRGSKKAKSKDKDEAESNGKASSKKTKAGKSGKKGAKTKPQDDEEEDEEEEDEEEEEEDEDEDE